MKDLLPDTSFGLYSIDKPLGHGVARYCTTIVKLTYLENILFLVLELLDAITQSYHWLDQG